MPSIPCVLIPCRESRAGGACAFWKLRISRYLTQKYTMPGSDNPCTYRGCGEACVAFVLEPSPGSLKPRKLVAYYVCMPEEPSSRRHKKTPDPGCRSKEAQRLACLGFTRSCFAEDRDFSLPCPMHCDCDAATCSSSTTRPTIARRDETTTSPESPIGKRCCMVFEVLHTPYPRVHRKGLREHMPLDAIDKRRARARS